MSIEEIQGTETVPYPVISEEAEERKKADLHISSYARPRIWTAFQEIQRLDDARVSILLSDGSIWNVNADESKDAFEIISQGWKSGDDLRMGENNGKVVLKNARDNTAFFVELSKKCHDLSKAFFIKKIDPTGYALRTTTGEIYVAGYFGSFTTSDWQEGQRIVINKSTHSDRYEDYRIFNADTQDSAWLTKVTV